MYSFTLNTVMSLSSEAAKMVFGLIFLSFLVYIWLEVTYLEPRKKKKELERLNEMIKAHQTKKANQTQPEESLV